MRDVRGNALSHKLEMGERHFTARCETLTTGWQTVLFVQEFRELCTSRMLSSDQLEIMSLLNKLHAVQLDNAELQSQLIVRQLGNRRRDLLIDCQHRHDNMARALISRQRVLITDSDIDRPADLQQLYDVYDKETHEIASYRHGSFLPPISTNKVSSRAIVIL